MIESRCAWERDRERHKKWDREKERERGRSININTMCYIYMQKQKKILIFLKGVYWGELCIWAFPKTTIGEWRRRQSNVWVSYKCYTHWDFVITLIISGRGVDKHGEFLVLPSYGNSIFNLSTERWQRFTATR